MRATELMRFLYIPLPLGRGVVFNLLNISALRFFALIVSGDASTVAEKIIAHFEVLNYGPAGVSYVSVLGA